MSMSKNINNLTDKATDFIEKVSTPSSRAGSTVERIGKMLISGVDEEVIALQMTKNSPTNTKYDVNDVRTCGKIYEDAKTKAIITAKQTRSLMEDVQGENIADGTFVLQPQ
ncbi:MAG: hypothetical protein WBI40_03050 [Methylococcaceae bacterium]